MRKVLLALFLTLGLIVAAPGAAMADPPVIDGGGTVPPKPGNGGGDGGGSGGGGGGGGSSPYVTQYVPLPLHATIWQVPEFGNHTVTCAKRAGNWYAVGITIVLKKTKAGDLEWVGADCQYPPKPYLIDVVCAGHVTLVVEGPFRNPAVKSSVLYRKTASSPFESKRSLSTCRNTVSAQASKLLPYMGRYALTATTVTYPCKVRMHPESQQDPEFVSCTTRSSERVWRAQVWCNGWSKDWSGNHSFTANECKSESRGTWQCQTGRVTYGGVAGDPIPAFHDGTPRPLTFSALSVHGAVRNVKAGNTSLTVDPASTPYRDGASSDLQPYTIAGAGSMVGRRTWNVGFQGAGMPGLPWTATRTAYFSADFSVKAIQIEAINMLTGEPTFSVRTMTQRLDASCKDTVHVAVYRARNTSQ